LKAAFRFIKEIKDTIKSEFDMETCVINENIEMECHIKKESLARIMRLQLPLPN